MKEISNNQTEPLGVSTGGKWHLRTTQITEMSIFPLF